MKNFFPAGPVNIMDRPLPLLLRVGLLLIMGLLPTWYVAKSHDPRAGFTRLILFGKEFLPRALPEVRQLHPIADSPEGFDGQLYAQIALDPLLRRPEFRTALDSPPFRSQRILLPALAYVLGLGKPALIIEVYAVLNLAFWFLLLAGLLYFLRAVSARDYLGLCAILFTTGSLISIDRALTDLPMATLGFYAIALGGTSCAVLISLAILTKPTSGLLLIKYAWPLPRTGNEIKTRAIFVAIALAAPILWEIYVYHVFGSLTGGDNIGWPFRAWALGVEKDFEAWRAMPFELFFPPVSNWEWRLFELLTPLSLMVQALYLAIRRDPASAYWWMGISFAALFICLASKSFSEQIGVSRTVLPMTIAFNIQLLREKGGLYALCFFAGNAGLLWGLHDMVAFCLR